MNSFQFSIASPKNDNQDTLFLSEIGASRLLALVADGVGGMGGGLAASLSVKGAALDAMDRSEFSPIKIIKDAHNRVNSLDIPHAATTASIVYVDGLKLEFSHTGDSRIYVLRGNGLLTLTTDQTEVMALIREGILTLDAAKTYRRRNVLTNAIEKGQDLAPQNGQFDLMSGDRILLLTDGVHKLLGKAEIRDASLKFKNVVEMGIAIQEDIQSRLVDDATMIIFDV